MKKETISKKCLLLPIPVVVGAIGLWSFIYYLKLFPQATFPSPAAVIQGLREDLRSGQMMNDTIASLFRVAVGFSLAVVLSVPLGLLLGHKQKVRLALLPMVNFFRSLSPLAWIPFAIVWFGIGDTPAIFLIFTSTFFPLVVATVAAFSNIPTVYFRVAREYGFKDAEMLTRVMLPAILPQVITALRVTGGVAWLVVVAAEMIAGRDGLGFAIWDARNGLRMDLLVCRMIIIGIIGVGLDLLLVQLTKIRRVRWGYDR
jgi:NitT/TauT family transport system permease protein